MNLRPQSLYKKTIVLYLTIHVNNCPWCEQRSTATAIIPRASGEAPGVAETLRHPAAECKKQHRVKNATTCGGLREHFASEWHAKSREGLNLEKGLNLLYVFASLQQLRLEEVCCTDEVPSVLLSSSPGQL